MRRLIAATAIAATTVMLPVAGSAATYTRECGGVVDTECSGWVCPTDCWRRDCLLWVDVQHNSQTALCVAPVAPA